MQHTFLYISLPLLLHDGNVKLSSYTFYGENVLLLLVFLFAFFLTAAHFHFLNGHYHFSFPHHRHKIFMCF